LKPFRVEFTFEDRGYVLVAADSEEQARAGALKLFEGHLNNPVITSVTEAKEEHAPMVFDSGSSTIN
jgi:hypothetical protein